MNSPEAISLEVARMLEPKDGTKIVTVARAKSIGFDCQDLLATCRYDGYVNYHFLNLPPENEGQATGKTNIVITIARENPLMVHTDIDRQGTGMR